MVVDVYMFLFSFLTFVEVYMFRSYIKLLKGLRMGLPIYVLKLNNPSKSTAVEGDEPEWLSEYQDVFPQELSELPLDREL